MAGHVFLVHGNLTQFACDVWLMPCGSISRPGATWRHAVADAGSPSTLTSWSQAPGRGLETPVKGQLSTGLLLVYSVSTDTTVPDSERAEEVGVAFLDMTMRIS